MQAHSCSITIIQYYNYTVTIILYGYDRFATHDPHALLYILNTVPIYVYNIILLCNKIVKTIATVEYKKLYKTSRHHVA